MNIFEILVLIFAVVVTFNFALNVRKYVRTGQELMQGTVNMTMLFAVSILLIIFTGWSSLHLLWIFPVCAIFGIPSWTFPLNLFSIPGRWFAKICCIGLDWDEVNRNTKKMERAREMFQEGKTIEEIKQSFADEE